MSDSCHCIHEKSCGHLTFTSPFLLTPSRGPRVAHGSLFLLPQGCRGCEARPGKWRLGYDNLLVMTNIAMETHGKMGKHWENHRKMMVAHGILWDLHGFAIEMLHLPMNPMNNGDFNLIFQFVYVNVYQRVDLMFV